MGHDSMEVWKRRVAAMSNSIDLNVQTDVYYGIVADMSFLLMHLHHFVA